MERLQLHEGHAAEVALLVLDPGLRLADLVNALRQKRGWQARPGLQPRDALEACCGSWCLAANQPKSSPQQETACLVCDARP